jgi:Asp-tRNA(Asn)/Glu-tRNA(Gln) amidotransferase B subunit
MNKVSYENKSSQALEGIAWKYFSLYIRQRDSDKNGYGYCITCGKRIHFTEGHSGHCLSRRYKAIKYDERNNNLQCVACNTFHGGRPDLYREAVDKKWGIGTYNNLLLKSKESIQRKKYHFIALIEFYKKTLNDQG